MRFKDEFIKELVIRLKENMDLIESGFNLMGIEVEKNKILDVEPLEFHSLILEEDNPYIFLKKIVYSVVNKQNVKIVKTNIICTLLFEIVNLILDEFSLERIEAI